MKAGELVIKKNFNCSNRALFEAWSRAGLLSKWFFGTPEKFKDTWVRSNFTVNGEYSLALILPDGSRAYIWGHYQAIKPDAVIVMSWNSALAKDCVLELNFNSLADNRSQCILKHRVFPDEAAKAVHQQGWQACLGNLEKLFED